MKKLIAILALVALVSGAAFAQIGANVIGTIVIAQDGYDADEDKDIVVGGGEMNRVRLQGAGENEEGTFGAWIRAEMAPGYVDESTWWEGLAWWKPIDQLKLTIGGNSDGIYGKEGVTGWMFYQMVSDTDVVNPNNVWYAPGGYYFTGFDVDDDDDWGLQYRHAFFGGFDGQGLMLDIMPMDMLTINIALPFIDMAGAETADIFKSMIAQVDLNLDFGNIAVTYIGDASDATNGMVFAYFNLAAVENLSLDVGLSYIMPGDFEGFPIFAGLGAKYDVNDAFGLKVRTVAAFGGDEDWGMDGFRLLFDVLPYYQINDNMKFCASVGIGMFSHDALEDNIFGWHVNPYIEIGNEWGPTFYAGLKVWNNGTKDADVQWALPIAIGVSF